jgi:cytochrome c biogenesis protein CcdA
LLLALFGSRVGIEAGQVRWTGAVILAAAGALLLIPRLQERMAQAAGPLIAWAGDRQLRFDGKGLMGQAITGALLGLVWSPCVGPTLGAAIALAAQGEHVSQVALTMAAFALGIASVLLAIALVSRKAFMRLRNELTAKAKVAKMALGGILLLVGVFILNDWDRRLEAVLVAASPDWLVNLTTFL